MRVIAPLREVVAPLRRYRVELLWLAFAAANYAAMIAWPSWETIPFHFVWISLTLLYGFRVWPTRPTPTGNAIQWRTASTASASTPARSSRSPSRRVGELLSR